MILVTGGAGYIGSHIVHALADRGTPVVVLDDMSNGCRALLPAGVELVRGNCGDSDLVRQTIHRTGVTAIIHCAGSISVVESVEDPGKYYRNNVANALTVAEAAIAEGVPRLLFSSTATVYGAPETERLGEDLPLAPVNPYAASKAMVERILTDIATAHPLAIGILRYFNVAGADPRLRTGQLSKQSTHLIKLAAEAVVSGSYRMQVTGSDFATPDGTGIRDYIHVADLAAAHVAALDRLAAGAPLVLNIGYGQGASVLEVLDTVDAVTGRPLIREMRPRRPGDVARLVADNSRALATLDWRPARPDLSDIVADAIAWERHIRSDPERYRPGAEA
jgi:UDP-glucose 4-epimerase